MPKTPAIKKRAPATLRSTSGAGFEFEDLISAWLLVKMLTGEQAPAIGGAGMQLQAQVSTLGWCIDDLLLTTQRDAGARMRLAISAKGNLQVSASGLPADFVHCAWEQWRASQSPMNRSGDGLALVTQGTHRVFDPNWREVKNACTGSDIALAMGRIRSNPGQAKVFNSVRKPDKNGPEASEEETIELIRRLHVLPVDLQLPYSETRNQAIAQCRQLLASGDATEAEKLWQRLVNVATEIRLRRGTINLQDLWSMLRMEFDLCHHPDYKRDWETLSNITSDYKTRIETELPSGYSVPRTEEKSRLGSAISGNAVTVVFGESGSGKSALVKNVLDVQFGAWTQLWFGPENLETALSATRRGMLPLRHELALVLNATVNPKNVLVIDSAERIDPAELGIIRRLLQAILAPAEQAGGVWRVVVITQTQNWVEGAGDMLGGRRAAPVELELITILDVMLALWASPSLGWLTAHDDTVSVLTNLRALGWVVQAGSALGSSASGLASHTAVSDRLWDYWTGNRPDVQALVMRLAKREASFERSFPLSKLEQADATTFTQGPAELPLHLNRRTNRIEFEHDLAADWARFQFLKQISTDVAQWAALAVNPLWTNSLRMLGQFLLRQPAETGTAWHTAFASAQTTELRTAGDILLDALCLDPEAEMFLSERVDLLLANNAKHLTRLLIRFHHIGTVPTGGVPGNMSSLGLYMEAQLRSVIIGRWPPVLRFLIAQREKLTGAVSTAIARIIQTWLTGTPRELSDGTPMPFRRELANMALAMARTVQVEKGHGVMYVDREPLLVTAALGGAADMPEEVGAWALELAGRREISNEVSARIADVVRQQAEQRAERFRTDAAYREKHEAKRRMSPVFGSSREKLPSWPLGARRRIDTDFREACLKGNAMQPLMRARPDTAAEVLLALIIEDQPEREYGSSRHEIELGLGYARDSYPTAFWKGPFFSFLQIAPDIALKALVALVNFCTERWVAEVMRGRKGSSPGLTLQLEDGKEKTFDGGWSVFDWTQTHSLRDGNLFCALDALERWLTLQLDAGADVTPYIERILSDGTSAALIGLLVNVGKHCPSLFTGVLLPLLTDPCAIYWDSARVEHVEFKFMAWSGPQTRDVLFEFARSWALAPHRQKTLVDIVVGLLKAEAPVAARLQALIPTWSIPDGPKESLEFRLISAMLDRENYRPTPDPETGTEVLVFSCPDDLRLEVESWQDENAKPLQYLLLPKQCEKLLLAQGAVGDDEAAGLYMLLRECQSDVTSDVTARAKSELALATTLIVSGDSWLAKSPEATEHAASIVQTTVAAIASTAEAIRSSRMGHEHDELKFAAHAAMHLWMKNDDRSEEWEGAVLRILTSGNSGAAATIVDIAYTYRDRLGSTWWRLLQAGVLWSGLVMLSPHHGDDDSAHRVWGVWLARLRRMPLRGKDASADDLRLTRVVDGCERLDFNRRMRAFMSGENRWQGNPERQTGMGLDWHFLGVLFYWLVRGTGTGDGNVDARLVARLWTYEAERAKQRARDDDGEYDLPSHFGYDVLLKLGELSIVTSEPEGRTLWESVLALGPEAHHALHHFIDGLFLRLSKGEDPEAFERVWRPMVEYGLAANWGKGRFWFYGERLICDLLGFGHADTLQRLRSGALLRMRDVYERWAQLHMGRDEGCVTRFCFFLAAEFGVPLRLDGLRWIAAVLKAQDPLSRWYRDNTGDAIIELLNTSLNQNAHALIKDHEARQALVDIAATLVVKNVPTALALQERIKLLR